MDPSRTPSTRRPLGLNPVVFGVACCIVSALAYTAVNICLRFLSTQFDPALQVWVVCMKELMTVVIIAPLLATRAIRGQKVLPSARLLMVLTVMGLLTQWVGNLPMIWAMSVVGLSITVPVSLGVNLTFSAVLGWLILRERITGTSAFAIGLMFLSVILFSVGASEVSKSVAGENASTLMTIAAVLAAVMAGTVYACLAIVIRRSVTGATSPSIVVFMITFVGVVTLGPWSLWQNGLELIYEIPVRDHVLMIVMGTLNLVGFISVAKGLEMTTVAHANVLTASQVAMGVVAGMILFDEPASYLLVLGVSLAIAGIIIIRPAHEEEIEVSTGV